jgi:wyosine [tRNA(Phe)-imidazoG37] synthetase (radical SAM superfamily)
LRHVFGPVPSRRLGLSLGIDPVVPKTCTLDCVYCELGPTTDKTVCRRAYVPADEVLEEFRARQAAGLQADYVTMSGSGEPTLNSGIGAIIEGVKSLTDVPVAVLTNGTLLADPEVRAALLQSDVVIPSLDAVSQRAFELVNRPHPSLDAREMVEGLLAFASEFSGRIWLETLFVEGMNDDYGEVDLIGGIVQSIRPERVQVNTVVRPPADARARPVPLERLSALARRLGPRAELIAGSSTAQVQGLSSDVEMILSMAARRPVECADVARVTGLSQAAAAKILGELVERGRLAVVRHEERLYYRTRLERG